MKKVKLKFVAYCHFMTEGGYYSFVGREYVIPEKHSNRFRKNPAKFTWRWDQELRGMLPSNTSQRTWEVYQKAPRHRCVLYNEEQEG